MLAKDNKPVLRNVLKSRFVAFFINRNPEREEEKQTSRMGMQTKSIARY